MTTPNEHPEGLPFEPTGPGWTEPDKLKTSGPSRSFLLSDHNIASIRRNHEAEFNEALSSLKQLIPVQANDPRTGLRTRGGVPEEHLERLAALSVFVKKGVVQ